MNANSQKTIDILVANRAPAMTLHIARFSTNHPAVRVFLDGKIAGFDPASPVTVDDQIAALLARPAATEVAADPNPPDATTPAPSPATSTTFNEDLVKSLVDLTAGIDWTVNDDGNIIIHGISHDPEDEDPDDHGTEWIYISDLEGMNNWWEHPIFNGSPAAYNDYESPNDEEHDERSTILFPTELVTIQSGEAITEVDRSMSCEVSAGISASSLMSCIMNALRNIPNINSMDNHSVIGVVSHHVARLIKETVEFDHPDASDAEWVNRPANSHVDVLSTERETNVSASDLERIVGQLLSRIGRIQP